MHGSGSARGCDSSGRLARRVTCRDAAICPELRSKRTRNRWLRSVANDPGCVKTRRGITTPGILSPVVMRRAKKHKNSSCARHYDQVRFRFHTAWTHSVNLRRLIAALRKVQQPFSDWRPLPASIAGGAGARPDHSISGPTSLAAADNALASFREKSPSVHSSGSPAFRKTSNAGWSTGLRSVNHLTESLGLRRRASANAAFASSISPLKARATAKFRYE